MSTTMTPRAIAAALALLLGGMGSASAQGLFSYTYEIFGAAGINGTDNDYAPTVAQDKTTIFFTSTRSKGSIGEADVYISKRSGRSFADPVNPGSPTNTAGPDGTMSLTGDGKRGVISAEGRDDGFGDTDIYLLDLDGNGRVTAVRNLGARVNTKYWESQPTISGDGKTIYFASNRPGGRGGTDIWMTQQMSDGQWGDPINMGPLVNTKKNERSPFVTPDAGTIYFASDGLAGFGGYDIFISVKTDGEWSQPSNLGSKINSDEDELFFFAPSSSDLFYYASARSGGLGGLDIYGGTPNVFGDGMFHLIVSVLDSNSNRPLPSAVSVIDLERGDTVARLTTNNQTESYEQILPAGRRYRVVSRIRDLEARSGEVQADANVERNVTLRFGAVELAEFTLGKYNIPFFVTGYYRPNTPQNLENLFPMLEGPLDEATYIERFKRGSRRYKQYKSYSESIESIFGVFVTTMTDDILPKFNRDALPGEILDITVTGYADPQPFVGNYVESEVVSYVDASGAPHTLEQNSRIGNQELSGLRAWYSAQEIDRLLMASGKPEYAELKSSGRIRYRYVGGGESRDNNNLDAQRRIHISVARSGAGGASEFDINKSIR